MHGLRGVTVIGHGSDSQTHWLSVQTMILYPLTHVSSNHISTQIDCSYVHPQIPIYFHLMISIPTLPSPPPWTTCFFFFLNNTPPPEISPFPPHAAFRS